MHLIYLDESGNSGLNLNDPQQPIFTLCAMVVDEAKWQRLETDLKAVLDKRLPKWNAIDDFEVHAVDLRRGAGAFAGVIIADRIAFRDEWMQVGVRHGVRLVHRSVTKKAYHAWLVKEFGSGVVINPHVAAFALVSRCVDNYLQTLSGPPLGIFISDENKETVVDVEKSVKLLRGVQGALRLGRIVEKGFFIDSRKSFPLQLCDLFTLSLKKQAEHIRLQVPLKPVDVSGIQIALNRSFGPTTKMTEMFCNGLSRRQQRKKEAARGLTQGRLTPAHNWSLHGYYRFLDGMATAIS